MRRILLLLILAGCTGDVEKKALLLLQKNRPMEAILLLEGSDSPKALWLRAKIYFKIDHPTDALKALKKLIKKDPSYKGKVVSLLYEEAEKLRRRGRKEASCRLFSEILSLDPTHDLGKNFIYLASWYYDREKYDMAIPLFEKGLYIEPENVDARVKLAYAYWRLGKKEEALHVVESGITRKMEWQLLYLKGKFSFEIAMDLIKEGKGEDAMIYLQKTIATGLPEVYQDDAFFYLGEIYLSKGKYKEAKVCMRKVIELNPFTRGRKIVREAEKVLETIEKMEGG
ncbi:hypothetical protein DRQ20_07520 [bacterium]|nr:MAG: hypothetical protein DRQ20_07520 [bacterium]